MTQKQQFKRVKNNLNGWLNLDKPFDMTSTSAVSEVKKILSPMKIGHAGTLDPLATGILPLALGEATKTVQYLMDSSKEYVFTVRFGVQTTTDDAEGEVMQTSDIRPSDEAINSILPHYIGEIEQLPPTYSALKIDGERAYDLARAGEEVQLQPRPVVIYGFKMLQRVSADEAIFHVECGKGTYVRSLARDIALSLGTFGHVSNLRRTRVGSFFENEAISLDYLKKSAINTETMQQLLLPINCALDDIPAVTVDGVQASRLKHGNHCYVSHATLGENQISDMYQVWHEGDFFAIAARKGKVLVPIRVFNNF
jgi:tRNA pseudouridine55 synthase